MSLPATREYNYAAGISDVRSADLNTMQDWIAGLGNKVVQPDVSQFVNIEFFTYSPAIQPRSTAVSATAIIPLTLERNWVISAVYVRAQVIGGGDQPTVALATRGDGVPTAVGGGTISGWGASFSTLNVTGLSETVTADNSYCLLLETPGGWTPSGTGFTVSQVAVVLARATPPAVPAP